MEIFTLDVSNVTIEPLYSGPCDPLSSGTYRVLVNNAGTEHVAKWILKVTENKITGKSFWEGTAGEDPIWGTIEGNTVVIERDCRTVSKREKCHQVYEGVIGATTIDGSWSGTGKRPTGSITWTLMLH